MRRRKRVSYIPGTGRYVIDILDSCAERETLDIPSGEFEVRMGKAYKIVFTLAAILSIAVGSFIHFFEGIESNGVEYLFFGIGICAALLVPTLLSYKCAVNKISMKERYFILFIKIEREVMWADVKYKKVKTGKNPSLILYNADKKRLISFEGGTVGYSRVLKMAKRGTILTIKSNNSRTGRKIK